MILLCQRHICVYMYLHACNVGMRTRLPLKHISFLGCSQKGWKLLAQGMQKQRALQTYIYTWYGAKKQFSNNVRVSNNSLCNSSGVAPMWLQEKCLQSFRWFPWKSLLPGSFQTPFSWFFLRICGDCKKCSSERWSAQWENMAIPLAKDTNPEEHKK